MLLSETKKVSATQILLYIYLVPLYALHLTVLQNVYIKYKINCKTVLKILSSGLARKNRLDHGIIWNKDKIQDKS